MIEQEQPTTKTIATVRDVCRMVGLSPARFYQLMRAGVFPLPVYDLKTRRPHFTQEQQEICLEVRRRNCGINGKPVLFYARRVDLGAPTRRSRASSSTQQERPHAELVEALKSLGLTSATPVSVDAAIKELFPNGPSGLAQGEMIRAVFLHLRRQSSGDSVGR